MTDPLDIGEDIITKPNPSFAFRFKMTSLDDMAEGFGAMGGGQDLGRPVVLMLDSLLLLKLSACCIFRSLFSRYGFVFRDLNIAQNKIYGSLKEIYISTTIYLNLK